MGRTISASAQPFFGYEDLEIIRSKTVFTISTEHDGWINAYRNLLIEDGLLPIGSLVLAQEYDPQDEATANLLDGLHRSVESEFDIAQVHFTANAATYPLVSILQSSAHRDVRFFQLDGEF